MPAALFQQECRSPRNGDRDLPFPVLCHRVTQGLGGVVDLTRHHQELAPIRVGLVEIEHGDEALRACELWGVPRRSMLFDVDSAQVVVPGEEGPRRVTHVRAGELEVHVVAQERARGLHDRWREDA